MLARESKQIVLKIIPTLNEAQTRWFIAKEAISLGRGGLKYMHELTGISRPTILRGIEEIKNEKTLGVPERLRAKGGGRKTLEHDLPGLQQSLKKIMEETTAGDPMNALLWTCKSTYKIAEELTKQGYAISQRSVHKKLLEMDYSLQLNVKHKEGTGKDHPNRDQQFMHINAIVKKFFSQENPVISVDAKKKELVGEFKNNGRTWRQKENPKKVNAYDYPSLAEGKATPYGAYDLQHNEGFVNVGMTHDTSEFAVNSILQWWNCMGKIHYPNAEKLLICADGGGSNGSRNRLWKYYLQKLSDALGIQVSVCHYPPGTSKWNKIEHKLFSFISLNWRGEPLISYETIVNLIGSTTTKQGLLVKAKLDKKNYEKGKKISNSEMEKINIKYDKVNPLWNYVIKPRKNSDNEK
jgi:Rhodopirellula transposase.